MDWIGAESNGPLEAVRAIHFAAAAVTTGNLIFRMTVAKLALRSDHAAGKGLQAQTLGVAWIGLATTLLSGVIWYLLQAVSMSGFSFSEAMTADVLSTVLNETQFGQVTQIRLGLAIILAACLVYDRFAPADWLGFAAGLGLTASLAWTGHAGSTPGSAGNLHLAADVLHLCAAAAWIGGLVPLALLLAAVGRDQAVASASLAGEVSRRFSTLGIISVATLLVAGLVNAWILVGSFNALLVTEYGRLLMVKIVVFAVMLGFAAVNRLWLTPRLALSGSKAPFGALRQLTRNTVIEIALGFTIFAIVGVLGMLHPAIHLF